MQMTDFDIKPQLSDTIVKYLNEFATSSFLHIPN